MCRMLLRYRISGPNPSSSVVVLDWSPDNLYASYVYNPSEVPHLWHYVIAPVLSHWRRGAMAL
jgi:hypothetical protein